MAKTPIFEIIQGLADAFPQKEIPDASLVRYAELLEDLPLESVAAACHRLALTADWFPTVAQIRAAVVSGPFGLDLAEAAWVEVEREARRVGYNRPRMFRNGQFSEPQQPAFSSPAIAAAALAVGWELLCTGDNSKGFIRDAFLKAFRSIQDRQAKAQQTGVMPIERAAIAEAAG